MSQRVMIVDDMPDIRQILRSVLEVGGHSIVAEAANGAEAFDLYLEYRPDITIMDNNMPVKTGLEAAKEILALDGNARIIMCSGGMEYKELASAAGQAGINEIITKPINFSRLLEIIR